MKKCRLKKHDQVIITTGKYKGKIGEITKVLLDTDQVLVSGINIVKRHKKPTSSDPGGVFSKTKPIHVSNVSLFFEEDGKNVKSKVKIVKEEGARKRLLKRNNQVVEEYDYRAKANESK